MELKILVFICNLIIPIIMLLFGLKFKNHSPRDINGIYGYRTSMSMKNKETWEFAHQYCGRIWIKLGFIMLIISFAFSLIVFIFNSKVQGIINIIVITVQTLALIISIFPVEKKLKNNFDENGNRRN